MNKEKFINRLKAIIKDQENTQIYFEGDKITISGEGLGEENDWDFNCFLPKTGRITNVYSNHYILTLKFSTIQLLALRAIEDYNKQAEPIDYVFLAKEYVTRQISVKAHTKEEAVKLAEQQVSHLKMEPSKNWILTKVENES